MPVKSEKIEKILAQMPTAPGVYLMKDKDGKIIYIGKSRSLKRRVGSYFNRQHDSVKTSVLVSQIEDIEFIVTGSEVEALILENNLIKKHKPRYNILLKDSKTYPYLRVTLSEAYPRLEKVRRVSFKDGCRYFGPFPSAYDLARIASLLSKTYRLCTKKNRVVARQNARPCLKYHLGLCSGACMGKISPEEYAVGVKKALNVLSGRAQPDFKGLKAALKKLSDNYRYEEAADVRDTLDALTRFFARQKVEFLKPVNLDFWGISDSPDRIVFSALFVRGGKILGHRSIDIVNNTGETASELFGSLLSRFYDTNLVPSAIYYETEPEGANSLSAVLSEKAGHKVELKRPLKGRFFNLLKLANDNAAELMRNLKAKGSERLSEAVIDLQRQLNLPIAPRHIECVDISHIQGVDPVASLVVFENGLPKKSEYRLFHIKTAMGGDDPASIGEVTKRRFTRLLNEGAELPDLYMVDGGITQVRAARRELDALGLGGTAAIGLAEREELLITPDGAETKLPFSSAGMRMLIKLRNEAHRFANTFQNKTHSKSTLRSSLLNIPGVGAVTLKKLILAFGSAARIASLTPSQLKERCRVPLKTAELIIRALKNETNKQKFEH